MHRIRGLVAFGWIVAVAAVSLPLDSMAGDTLRVDVTFPIQEKAVLLDSVVASSPAEVEEKPGEIAVCGRRPRPDFRLPDDERSLTDPGVANHPRRHLILRTIRI
jgi:hypothetical protein